MSNGDERRDLPDSEVIREPIGLSRIKTLADQLFGDMVKAVVDVDRRMMAVGGELHSDEEARLLSEGSRQADLWGINLYPDHYPGDDWIEFDSMINIRPTQQNRSRSVEDAETREQIRRIVEELVTADE